VTTAGSWVVLALALPRPGELVIACEWPNVNVEPSTGTIGADRAGEAVGRARELWTSTCRSARDGRDPHATGTSRAACARSRCTSVGSRSIQKPAVQGQRTAAPAGSLAEGSVSTGARIWRIARLLRFRGKDLLSRQSGAPDRLAAPGARARARTRAGAWRPTVTTTSGPTAWRDPQVATSRCHVPHASRPALMPAGTC
jgi:hypothetical protein